MTIKKFSIFSSTKITSLVIGLGFLSGSWSCVLFLSEQDMFDRATLEKVFVAVQNKGREKKPLYEIDINYNEVYFSSRFRRFVYSRGYPSQAKPESTDESKPFQLAEAAFDLDQVRSKVLEYAKKIRI